MKSKWLLMSRTVWGALMMGAAAAAMHFNWTFWPDIEPMLNEVFTGGLALVGFILNIIGRVKASRPVTMLPRTSP